MKPISGIKNNEGAIIEEGKKPVAVYKDANGKIHKLSPICTHMGCTVNWDDKNKNWNCPCHNAAYSPNGHVTRGPATKDLTIIE